MNAFEYIKTDAFTAGGSSGNPAACLYLRAGQSLSEARMQEIAREHKGFVSEVIYCSPAKPGQAGPQYQLRYYSSECEVDFCGHGTIACLHYLARNAPELRNSREISIGTVKGDLTVHNELQDLDAVFITAPDPQFLPLDLTEKTVAAALGLAPEALDPRHGLELIDAGLRTLIVPIRALDATLELRPDEPALKEFCLSNGLDIILVFCTSVADSRNKIRSRVFAPKFGYLEDKATGSGNSALGYYMLKRKLWEGEPISVEQNGERLAYNTVRLKTLAGKVLFGGGASVRIRGEYLL